MKSIQKQDSEKYISPSISIRYFVSDCICASQQVEWADGDIGDRDIFDAL